MESTSSILDATKASFLKLLLGIQSDSERRIFLDWVVKEVNLEVVQNSSLNNCSTAQYDKITDQRNVITRISSYIKEFQIVEASNKGLTSNGSVWNSENLHYPSKFSIGGDSDDGLSSPPRRLGDEVF